MGWLVTLPLRCAHPPQVFQPELLSHRDLFLDARIIWIRGAYLFQPLQPRSDGDRLPPSAPSRRAARERGPVHPRVGSSGTSRSAERNLHRPLHTAPARIHAAPYSTRSGSATTALRLPSAACSGCTADGEGEGSSACVGRARGRLLHHRKEPGTGARCQCRTVRDRVGGRPGGTGARRNSRSTQRHDHHQ